MSAPPDLTPVSAEDLAELRATLYGREVGIERATEYDTIENGERVYVLHLEPPKRKR